LALFALFCLTVNYFIFFKSSRLVKNVPAVI